MKSKEEYEAWLSEEEMKARRMQYKELENEDFDEDILFRRMITESPPDVTEEEMKARKE